MFEDRKRSGFETRRTVLKQLAAGTVTVAGASALTLTGRYAQAASSTPIRIGFQVHRTGIGASYGRWYDRTTKAAAKFINEMGGINGRNVEIVTEDDGTDPKRGTEVMEKFAKQHKCDVVFGTLFSHVAIATSNRAGELKMPYLIVSEGHMVADGSLNRYTLQPGITEVKSQALAMAPYVANNLGKKVTMIYPDFAFGYDHRDNFGPAIERQGGKVVGKIAVPPVETSFTKYFAQIPRDTEVLYHVMVGPGILTFVRELGQFFGDSGPRLFGFIDSLEAIDLKSPGLEFLDGSHFWEAYPRYAPENQSEFDKFYRQRVGVNANGASVSDPKDVSTYSHMFGCWETMFVIKAGMEASGYSGPKDRQKFIEAIEGMTTMPHSRRHPQGAKIFNGKTHQVFGHQHISRLQGGKLSVVHQTSIEDTYYPDKTDYTKKPF